MDDIEFLYYTVGALSREFCTASILWVDEIDPDYALTFSESFDLFAMYCMAPI